MECKDCGGLVLWMGPIHNLTHTECQSCGLHNNQIVDDISPEEEDAMREMGDDRYLYQ